MIPSVDKGKHGFDGQKCAHTASSPLAIRQVFPAGLFLSGHISAPAKLLRTCQRWIFQGFLVFEPQAGRRPPRRKGQKAPKRRGDRRVCPCQLMVPYYDSTFAPPWQPCYPVRLHGFYVSMTFSNGNMRFCRFTKKVLPCIMSTVIHNMNCFSFLSSNRQKAARWCGFRRVWDIFAANRRLCHAQTPVFVIFLLCGQQRAADGLGAQQHLVVAVEQNLYLLHALQ